MTNPNTCSICNCIPENIGKTEFYQSFLALSCDILAAIQGGGGLACIANNTPLQWKSAAGVCENILVLDSSDNVILNAQPLAGSRFETQVNGVAKLSVDANQVGIFNGATRLFYFDVSGTNRRLFYEGGSATIECNGSTANSLILSGGNTPDYTSGGCITLYGNTAAGNTGKLSVVAGQLAGSVLELDARSTTSAITLNINGSEKWRIDSNGSFKGNVSASKIIGGATSLSIRNHADSADNLLIADGGLVTVGVGNLTLTAGNLTFSAAAAKIIPGVTSLTFTNNANSNNNIVINDDGTISLRNSLTLTGGNIILQGGPPAYITPNTIDGSDNKSIALVGGGTDSNTRGAFLRVSGNEATGTGVFVLAGGSVGSNSSNIDLGSGTSSLVFSYNGSISNVIWKIDASSGDFSSGVNGGNVVVSRTGASTEVRTSDGTITGKIRTVTADKFYVGTSSAHSTALMTSGSQRWSIDTSGNIIQDGTNGGDFVYSKSAFNIEASTADASDNAQIVIAGGGSGSNTRGGFIQLSGNEHANTGSIQLTAGNVTGGVINLSAGGSVQMKILSGFTFQTVSGNEATGAGVVNLGSNSPATVATPQTWIKLKDSAGNTVCFPVWKI